MNCPQCGQRIHSAEKTLAELGDLDVMVNCAANGGQGLLTRVMALELAEHGITINAIAHLTSSEASYTPGHSFVVDGGMLLMAAVANQQWPG